jgi:predicted  nucleic acid-binding Zn-ribbon protein
MKMGDEAPPPPRAAPGGDSSVSSLMRLLEVQDHDTAIDQLHHRRQSLPERTELSSAEARLAVLEDRSKEVGTQRDEFATRQSGLEQQIEASRSRRADLERRMFGGLITAPRELQAMDDEVKHLVRHIAELEDRELEIMEASEPLDAELGAAQSERVALEERARNLREAIVLSESSLDAELAAQVAERDEVASRVPQELLARYEQLRKKLGGTGAARLIGGSCGGCHLALPSMEVDRIRKAPPDAVITCDQCGRILVR